MRQHKIDRITHCKITNEVQRIQLKTASQKLQLMTRLGYTSSPNICNTMRTLHLNSDDSSRNSVLIMHAPMNLFSIIQQLSLQRLLNGQLRFLLTTDRSFQPRQCKVDPLIPPSLQGVEFCNQLMQPCSKTGYPILKKFMNPIYYLIF